MFGRGNWAIIGLTPESLPNFKTSLNNKRLMLSYSQLAADAVTRYLKHDQSGINPFKHPRLDEDEPLSANGGEALSFYARLDEDSQKDAELLDEIEMSGAFAFGAQRFQLDDSGKLFGLWFVTNQYKDVSHVASIKEEYAYTAFNRPVKFLDATDKKVLDVECKAKTAASRKQFPVLIDFDKSRIFMETTNKAEIESVQTFLQGLGIQLIQMAWQFDVSGHWPSKVLTQLFSETEHADAFKKRAEDVAKFSGQELEKLEDLELNGLVTKYFSTTSLGGDQYASLSAPAQVTLHPSTSPIAAQVPTNATTLLGITDDAGVYSASVTIQERITTTDKKTGGERSFRKDIVTFDINDQINVVDVGAACIRGFDLPGFKKRIQTEIKKTKQVPDLERFWRDWLVEMNHAVQTIQFHLLGILGLDVDDEKSGLKPAYTEGSDVVIEGDELTNYLQNSELGKQIANGTVTVTVTHGQASAALEALGDE